jgi:SAM-dependent methyltransferase
MERPPDDEAERREALKQWAGTQQRSEWVRRHRKSGREQLVERVKRALTNLRWRLPRLPQRLADRVLDRGLDTSQEAVEPEHDHSDRLRYVASPWHVLPRALRYLGVSESDTFVEFGCGKGRVVHQAARWPFHRVIGVEISPTLAEIAEANLTARSGQHRCRNVEIVVADITEYEVPDDLTIAYLYHPVTHESFRALLRELLASLDRRPRRVRLIYVYPILGSEILATGRFRLLKRQRMRLLDTPGSETAIYESL